MKFDFGDMVILKGGNSRMIVVEASDYIVDVSAIHPETFNIIRLVCKADDLDLIKNINLSSKLFDRNLRPIG